MVARGPYVCPPACTRPPLGTPVETNPRFTAANGAFSVSYPGEGSAYQVSVDPTGRNGVELKYIAGDTGTLALFGEPAAGRTPTQIVQQLVSSDYDGAAESAATGCYARLFRGMLDRGVALAPGPYEVAFPSLAHGAADFDLALAVAAEAAEAAFT